MVSIFLILAISEGDSIPVLGRSAGGGIGFPLQYSWASLVAQLVKNPPALQETYRVLSWEDPLEKEKGYPLQYSGLENSMECIVHGVTKSQTRLSDVHFTSLHFWWCIVVFHFGFNFISFWLMMLSFLTWPYFQLCIFPLWDSYWSLLLILWLFKVFLCVCMLYFN